jgi:phosphatidylserine decarboxylase
MAGVIQDLIEKADDRFKELLTVSLTEANSIALNGDQQTAPLDQALYHAIEETAPDGKLGWPTDFDGYVAYLRWFYRWTPHQSGHPGWKRPGTSEYQEAYDRLCHFYWLIDQPVGDDDSVIVQIIDWFSDWLVAYATTWGKYLDTSESWNDEYLEGVFEHSPWYSITDYMIYQGGDPAKFESWRPNSPSGWRTFNQFFARELNPGLRPVMEPTDNAYVTSPADCGYHQDFLIGPDSEVTEVTLKGTHRIGNVKDLLAGSGYADQFANGHFVHYFLAPYSYHRFHTPVAGTVNECYATQGKVFLNVILGGEGGVEGQFNAPDGAEPGSAKGGEGYEFNQARGVITIDTAGSTYGDIGVVAVIPIGMCQVSGVNMTHPAQLKKDEPGSPLYNAGGYQCEKGEEFGFFTFGGSDIIILFQERARVQLVNQTNYHHYGTLIARCTPWES